MELIVNGTDQNDKVSLFSFYSVFLESYEVRNHCCGLDVKCPHRPLGPQLVVLLRGEWAMRTVEV